MTEHDLEEFAVLKVRKSTMPPGASLVVCYDDGSGVPVIADDLYPEFVVVRREDLEIIKTYEGQLRSFAHWTNDADKINRLKAALEKP